MQTAAYPFITPSEKTLETGSALTGLALMGAGLSLVFHPLALVAAGAYAAYNLAPVFQRKKYERLIRESPVRPLDESEPACRLIREISDRFDMPAPPLYLRSADSIAAYALPPGQRWLRKRKSFDESFRRDILPRAFIASPERHILFTTREALDQGLPENEMRFILAHEIAHLKTDAFSPVGLGRKIIQSASKFLALASVAAIAVSAGLAAFGLALPLLAGASSLGTAGALKALGTLVVLHGASSTILNIGTRSAEKRADRNALYVTGDLESAQAAMDKLHGPDEKNRRPSFLEHALSTHPGHARRLESLASSFNLVKEYPPPPAANNQNDQGFSSPDPQAVTRCVQDPLSRSRSGRTYTNTATKSSACSAA